MKVGKLVVNSLKKNDRVILTSITVVGTVAAVIFAWKARSKCEKKLDELRERDATNAEKAKEIIPIVAPAAVATGVAVTSAIVNHKVTSDKLTALASALTIAKTAHDEYVKATGNVVGDEVEATIGNAANDAAAKKLAEGKPVVISDVKDTGHGRFIFREPLTGKTFRASKNFIEECAARLNNELACAKLEGRDDFEVTLNDLFEELDLEKCELGDMLSWKWTKNECIRLKLTDTFEYNGEEPGYLMKFTRYGSPSFGTYVDSMLKGGLIL